MHDEQGSDPRSTEPGSYLLEAGLSVTTAESCTGAGLPRPLDADIAGEFGVFSARICHLQ